MTSHVQTARLAGIPHGSALNECRDRAISNLLSHQSPEGFWWYTLEANESIGAGFIQLMHFLDEVDPGIEGGLVRRMLSQQRADGSWSIFYGGPGDLSTTVECYFALRLTGLSPLEEPLNRAKNFILSQGGLTKARVFTRIHFALFGIVPWSSCPSMPVWFMLLPPWCGVSIYEFSTWARASIVPLLLLDSVRPVKPVPFDLSELFVEPPGQRIFSFPRPKKRLSLPALFLGLDRILKLLERLPWHPGKELAVRRAEEWTRAHLARTEDIYPAMAYGILGLKALGYSNDDSTIRKAFAGLKRFQQKDGESVHQQCCISPNWDTPWAGVALLDAGVPADHPSLLKAARYMISKEVKNFRGDWAVKNSQGPAGGWSFEFENDYFPDIDDTIEAVHFLKRVALPPEEIVSEGRSPSGVNDESDKNQMGGSGWRAVRRQVGAAALSPPAITDGPIARGLAWMLAMQSSNGGWAAFDKNNLAGWVNKIPFADHGACLDPPTPDVTGRMIELLALFGHKKDNWTITKAIRFIEASQEKCGAWKGRWGVNYIYGTWCVLQGLRAIGYPMRDPTIRRAIRWMEDVQNTDGGWGESCLSDAANRFVPLEVSTASQTAWAVLGLIAAGEHDSLPVRRGIDWLVRNQNEEGGWDEPWFTGTGFPGHFYIRYHGYRHFFPLLALAGYLKR